MPASMPTRPGGRFTDRAAIRAREIFSRRTIAPFSSRPIICSVFLPVSIPMVRATPVSALLGMACPPRALQSPQLTLRVVGGGSTAGPSHSRQIQELRISVGVGWEADIVGQVVSAAPVAIGPGADLGRIEI